MNAWSASGAAICVTGRAAMLPCNRLGIVAQILDEGDELGELISPSLFSS
jgi:hypothetical protein